MATRRPQLAKLTRPRLHNAVARERLFALLDEAREHKPAICVVGPPGAGKTTLVASWLDARNIKGIWYQVDPGDADLATFFYYLGEAAKPFTRKGQQPLPALTPEYLQDVEGFSRRFFRELFSRLSEGAVLVLDNYQEVSAEKAFHQFIAHAAEDVPAGMTLIAISRRDPPDCYARLIANENVQLVDWDDLQLTFEETRRIVEARGPIARPEEIERLHRESGGWAAGLTLILEGYRKNNTSLPEVPAGREAVFGYFAAQIFDRVSEDTRQFLMATSFLPTVQVSVAEALTGEPASGAILEDLYRRHFFTHRRPGQEPTYWYHALFRDFLKMRASVVLGRDRCQTLMRRAAALLAGQAAFDDAFQLFAKAGDWGAAVRLVKECASDLLAQGRGQTLRDWTLVLPASALEANPWLRYWLGISLIPLNQRDARRHLEFAFGQFGADGDSIGQALSAAGVIESYFFEWTDFHPMRRWVDTLELLIDRLRFSERSDAERRINTSLLVGILYAAPGHRMLHRIVERVTVMLDEDMDANSKVSLAMVLLSYCNLACDMERGRRTVASVEPLINRPELTPFNQLWWYLRFGYHHLMAGNYEAGREALDRAIGLSEAHGFQGLRRTFLLIVSYQISLAASTQDLPSARKWYARMVAMADPARPMDLWHVVQSRAHVECTTSDYNVVAVSGEKCVELAVAAGMTYIEILAVEHWATGCAVLGQIDRFHQALARLRLLSVGTCYSYFECAAKLLEAYVALVHGGKPEGRRLLSDGLDFARSQRFEYPQMARYSVVPRVLLAEALRTDIHREYATEVVRRLRIPPPPDSPESWPWPVKIYTLGRYEVYRDEVRLEFSGKVPKKPLMLLKALIAFGGRNVPEERLMDALWPDEEADAARKSLDITVLRLRKLLGSHEAIVVSDEQFGLNPQFCWTDVWAFERRVAEAETAEVDAGLSAAAAAVDLYRGNFLPADAEEPWTVKARERLRGKFVRLVESVAQADEAAGHWDKAMAYYLKGLEADDLVEVFHLGLMRCYRALGRPAEAITVFRRLRQTLSVVLGIAPSPAAEALARELREGSAARYT